MVPELIKKEDFAYPHEYAPSVPQEPHFQRLWGYYRSEHLTNMINDAASKGNVSEWDASEAKKFLGAKHHLSVTSYVYQKAGIRNDLAEDEGYLATDRVMKALGVEYSFSKLTAADAETQFWNSFDVSQNLNEEEMRKLIPLIVSDPQTRMRIDSQASHSTLLEAEETTEQLSA